MTEDILEYCARCIQMTNHKTSNAIKELRICRKCGFPWDTKWSKEEKEKRALLPARKLDFKGMKVIKIGKI